MADWSKNLTTCQSVSRGRPNLELAAQSRQLQPFFQRASAEGATCPAVPILYPRNSRYSTGTQTLVLLPGAKGPPQLRPWFRYLGQAADGLTSWGAFSTCQPFKIDPLSVSFSSSMRLKDCLWSNSANDQRFRLFFDMEIIQSCTSHDPETSPKFRWKWVLFLCLSEVDHVY